MSRQQIWDGIYTAVVTDATLMAVLGQTAPTDARVLRSWPQLQVLLTDYEPQQEGWLVIDEPRPDDGQEQSETIYEIVQATFQVYATQFSLIDDVIDQLDTKFNWSIEQQRDLSFGERLVLMTRRLPVVDGYNTDVKLPQKVVPYRMVLVLETQPA